MSTRLATAYRTGAVVDVSAGTDGEFCIVHTVGNGFRFGPERIGAFIASNGFGKRLAEALQALDVGDAVAINAARQRLVVCRPLGNAATIRRRFRLTRDLF